jgi:hypothetical protein
MLTKKYTPKDYYIVFTEYIIYDIFRIIYDSY